MQPNSNVVSDDGICCAPTTLFEYFSVFCCILKQLLLLFIHISNTIKQCYVHCFKVLVYTAK